jgi:hypothetical protein
MSVTTEADEHVARAESHVAAARAEIGKVHLEHDTMWGADKFRDGYIKNLFDRLDALVKAFDGKDRKGEARAAKVPRLRPAESEDDDG